MAKTILYELAKKIISYKFLTSITGSISDRAKRRYEKLAKEAGERLKKKDSLPEDSELILNLIWDDKAVSSARNYTLALEEFKQKNPEAYIQFDEILKKHRTVRRAQLEFGGRVSEKYYIKVIQEIMPDLSEGGARLLYGSLLNTQKTLKKKKGLTTFLLPE